MVYSRLDDAFAAAWWIGIVLSMSFLCTVFLTSQYSWDRPCSVMILRVWDRLPLRQPVLVVELESPSPRSGYVPSCVPITSWCCLSRSHYDADWRLTESLMIPPWWPPPPYCSCIGHPLHALTVAEGSLLGPISRLQLGPMRGFGWGSSWPLIVSAHIYALRSWSCEPMSMITHHLKKSLIGTMCIPMYY